MKIVHVITRLIVGGAQENTVLTCEGLHARGHDVTLISGPTTGPEGRLVERARAGGYRFIELPPLVRPVKPFLDWAATRELTRLYRDLAPDVVHTHSSKAGILGRYAADRARVPAILHTIHGMSFNRTQPWLVRKAYATLERWAARRTHRIATVADAMIEQAVSAGVCPREKLITVYSGMEVERFDPTAYEPASKRASVGVKPDEILVATVARLFQKKGYEQLIPIMAKAAARNRALRFLWIGDGAQRADYERELHRLGLASSTILTGLVPPGDIPGWLSACDLLAHTSQWEGLPRAVVQALLMQKPAIAFDIDGTPEVVLDGVTGRLIRLGDEDGFVSALLELSADAGLRLRMGQAGRAHCLERFDHRCMVDALELLYAETLDRVRAGSRR